MNRANRGALLWACSIGAFTFGMVDVERAHGATLLDFENGGADGGEALVNTNVTAGTFGVTHGNYAGDIIGATPSSTLFDIGTVTSGSAGAALDHFNAINAGLAEQGPLQISFDVSLDTSMLSDTDDGYYQLTLVGNGDTGSTATNGYFQLGYGNFINGYNIKNGFSLGSTAVSDGVTLTSVTPYANGIGTYHVTVPIFNATANSDYNHPTFTPGSGYYQFSLYGSGGFGGSDNGTINLAVDDVQIGTSLTPEPASLALLTFSALPLLRRRKRKLGN